MLFIPLVFLASLAGIIGRHPRLLLGLPVPFFQVVPRLGHCANISAVIFRLEIVYAFRVLTDSCSASEVAMSSVSHPGFF